MVRSTAGSASSFCESPLHSRVPFDGFLVSALCVQLPIVPAVNNSMSHRFCITSCAPILLCLAFHRRCFRVLHLEPIGRAAGAIGRVLPIRKRCLLSRACRRGGTRPRRPHAQGVSFSR